LNINSIGATLTVNRLKVLDDGIILRSQVCLVTSRRSRAGKDMNALCENISNTLTD